MPLPSVRPSQRALLDASLIAAALLVASLVVAVLEWRVGLANASPTYLIVVVIAAIRRGALWGVVVALIAMLLYDLLFTQPALTLEMTDPQEWLDLVLLSFVAVTVGHLVALQRRRTAEAVEREREAADLYAVSRAIITAPDVESALGTIVAVLDGRTGLDRVWVGLGPTTDRERIVADSGQGPLPEGALIVVLSRTDGTTKGQWISVHTPGRERRSQAGEGRRHRVAIEAAGEGVGSIWGIRAQSAPLPDPTATRLLAATADQVGQAVHAERLAERAAGARIAREGDALKSALVESVSHDLRIPLASIRAAAGPLIEPDGWSQPADVREAGLHIDREAARLDRLVADLLDLGRVQAGMLKAHVEAVELQEVVVRVLEGLEDHSPDSADRPAFQLDLPETWVDADPLLLQQVLQNVLENTVRHTPPGTLVRISAQPLDDSTVRLVIEDAGPGVSDEALPRLFDRFYRQVRPGSRERPGSGLGLAVARGSLEAMGGRIRARHGDLGGLAFDIDLSAMSMPGHRLGAD